NEGPRIGKAAVQATRVGARVLAGSFSVLGSARGANFMRTDGSAPLTTANAPGRALWMSTIAFTACFAVWTIFSIIGVRLKDELGLNDTEFGLLIGTPILTGSLVRIFLGIWTDRFGGRLVFTLTMLAASVATVLLAFAHTYTQTL